MPCSSPPKVNLATALKFSTVFCFEGFHLAQARVFQLALGCCTELMSVSNLCFSFLICESRLSLKSLHVVVNYFNYLMFISFSCIQWERGFIIGQILGSVRLSVYFGCICLDKLVICFSILNILSWKNMVWRLIIFLSKYDVVFLSC